MLENLPSHPRVRALRAQTIRMVLASVTVCALAACGSDDNGQRDAHDAGPAIDANLPGHSDMDAASPPASEAGSGDSGSDEDSGAAAQDATLGHLDGSAPEDAAGGDATSPSDAAAATDADTEPVADAGPDASAPNLTCYTLRAFAEAGSSDPFAVGTSDREMEFRFEPVQREAAYAIRISPLIESRWVHELRLYATDKVIAPTVTQAHLPSSEQLLYVWTPEGKPLDLHALDAESGFALPEWASFIMQIHYAGGHHLAKDQSGVEICMTAEARIKPMSISVVSAEGIPGSSSTMGVCEPALTSPVDIMAILPHMRSRGHSMQVSLLREDGSEDKLHDDTFTYGEQQWLVRHATVAPKDRISVQCEYSEKVTFGLGLEYEVCHLYALTASADVLRNEKPLILPNTCVGLPGGF